MKSKRFLVVFLVLGIALLLTACGHTHTFGEDWTNDETHHWHASTCEHTTEVSEKAEHSWDAGTVTTEPTEEAEGEKTFKCTVCEATKVEVVDKLAHTHKYSDDWSNDANHHWHASTCGHESEVSGKEEHEWDEGTVTTEPTEEAEGVELFTCKVCGATKEESVAKLPHTHKYQETWTSDEEYHWHGSACGHEEEVKDLAGHTWDEGAVTKVPTCEANGEKTFACTVCGATKVEPVSKDANAHTFQETLTYNETHHWYAAACSHEVKQGEAEHVWDEGKVTTEPTYYEEGVKTFACACGATRTEAVPVLKNFENENWTSLTEEGYYYLDGAVISNVSEDLGNWFNYDQTNFNLYNTQMGKNYTINVDVKGVSNTETHPTLLAGVVVWYQDADNYIIFGAHWSDFDRPHEIRSFWFKGLIDGEVFAPGDAWCDGCFTLPVDGVRISVSKSSNIFTWTTTNIATGATIKTGSQTIPGTNTVSSKVGVYGVNEAFSFTNFTSANIEAAPLVYTTTVDSVVHTLTLSMMTDEFTLVQGETTLTGTYTENGRNKTLTFADGTVQYVRTISKGNVFDYITLKTMDEPDAELTNEWTVVQSDITGDYTISLDFLGTLAYEGVSAKLGFKAWYVDENNYIDIYLEWGAADRPHELKCVQITGYLNGTHIGWFDIWTDNSRYLPIDGGHLTITKEGQKFTATYSNDYGYSKSDSRTVAIDTSVAYKIYAYAEGDIMKVDNFTYKYIMPTSAVTYNSEDGTDKLVVDTTSNNCVLTVDGVEYAGYYTLDGAYGIVTVGEEQKHFKLVVDKSLLILYTPSTAEEDPNAVTVTPNAAVELATGMTGDFEVTMDVKGLINSNVTEERTVFIAYPWYLDENNYVEVRVEWWDSDRAYEIRSIVVNGYIGGSKVASTEKFGDWPSTYTLPADGFKLTISKTGNIFNVKLVSALTGVEKVNDALTVSALDTTATYSVKAGAVTDTFTISNVAGLPEVSEPTPVTASKTVASLITEYGWTDSTTKQTFNIDENVSVTVNGGSNSGKAYDGDHIRIYATDTPAGTLTITVAEGYELVSVKISTVTGTYAFLYVDGTTTDICNQTVEVSGSSVVLNSVKNGSNGKQVRVTGIEVVYKEVA